MEVVRLGERYTTSYQPDKLIEGYSSMIFTERWPLDGDFELVTPLIGETMALLPVDTLISHTESDEVMIVDNHTIEEDELGRQMLKVTGSSLTGFINHRYVDGKYGKKREMIRQYTDSGALAVLLWQAFVNNTGKDVTRDGAWDWGVKDVIPNTVITESATDDGESDDRWLVKGLLGDQVREILTKGELGLRTIRPKNGSSGTLITVEHSPQDRRGVIIRTAAANITQLRFDIYDGVDRSGSVKFRTLNGDLDKIQYLFSKSNYKSAIEIMTAGVKIADQHRAGESGFTGIQRRVGALDVGEPDVPDEPQRPKDPRKNATKAERENYQDALDKWREDHSAWETKRDNIITRFRNSVLRDAGRMLKDTSVVSVLSGDISPEAPYVYGVDYKLGDKVTLYGDYDQTETMVVSEYIRSEDENGDHGYPGLTLP